MASHWPILIGINQYQQLQPLMYAQFDATELKDFWVNEAGLPPQTCVLLTDVSPMVYEGSAFPSREVILQRLAQTAEQAAPEDTVLFFFSGYGVHWEGQDYLLPIDADPNRIAQTGILMETLLKTLAGGNQAHTLVILDMNRPQAAVAPSRLGQQTIDLAKDMGIPLLLSCQPHEFSQETLAVRHGLFSEALLEGLRFHGCLTLDQMVNYLANRVPELCRHHWRPEQHPMAVFAPEQRFLMLVPPSAAALISGGESAPIPGPVIVDPSVDEVSPEPEDLGSSGGEADIDPPIVPSAVPPLEPLAPSTTGPESTPPGALVPSSPGAITEVDQEPDPAGVPGWLPWGLFAAGLLLFGVLFRNQAVFWGSRDAAPPVATDTLPADGETVEVAPAEGEAAPEAPATPEPSPEVPPVAADALFPGTNIDGPTALALARRALETRQFGEALTWLNQIPEGERPEDYDALVAQAEVGQASAVDSGDAVLSDARRLVEPVSASLFNDAIERARQVPMGDPSYDQAQADIARWSQVILDLANGRAASGNFDGAISAARLVPADQGDTYAQAQAEIQRWEQRKTNRALLQQAQSMLQPDQATSFRDAILLLQQIPPDYPESATAQERINQWSQDILVIARARAAVGDLQGAIAAAERVPPDTSAYDQAQQEMSTWQSQ